MMIKTLSYRSPSRMGYVVREAQLGHAWSQRKFFPDLWGPNDVKKAFSGGALILDDIDGRDFNMPTNSNTVIWYFAWRGLAVHLIFYVFMSKGKTKSIYIYIYIYMCVCVCVCVCVYVCVCVCVCKKLDWKSERAVYAKGEPKERVWESPLDWKPERAV